jgi:hypothetical protein
MFGQLSQVAPAAFIEIRVGVEVLLFVEPMPDSP